MNRVSTRECRKKLALVWFLFGGFLVLLVIGQSLAGKFGEHLRDVWRWFLPTLLPTLSLIVSVIVVDLGTGVARTAKQVDRFLYRLALWFSVVYLFIVAATFLLQPILGIPNLELIKVTDLWLGPLQGLLAGVLGVFFVKGEQG